LEELLQQYPNISPLIPKWKVVPQECKRKYGWKVVVGMVLMMLGELYLPVSLRGDERNIGGYQKKKERY
jgi:hypothetical protein